ncbi:unnamed protein product [Caretta caretta]
MDLAAEDSWRLEWGDRVYFSHLTVRTAGVATLFSPDLWPEVLGVAKAVPGCLLHLRVRMEGLVVNLINVYAPTSGPERLLFYQQASAFLGTLDPHECLVLGGDFNATLEERDRSGTEQCLSAADVLWEIVEHHSLVDVWRDHHLDDISTFTFVRVEAHWLCHSQLDRIYLSRFHLSRAHSSTMWPTPFSDHCLATVMASLHAQRPVLAYWHFNNSLLEDVVFVAFFREFWLAWRGQRRAIFTLLPKKVDLCDLRNWRPISFLSTDYKIVAKAILLRLGSMLEDMIHPDQTYTFPGCTIFDNLYLVRDLLELGCRDGLLFTLLSLDQEKAFDRVDHGYLLGTLRALGFGSQFVGFLQVLYASAECLVRLNWTLTQPLRFGPGVRQGCPLSEQLYALVIEPFLCLLCRRLMGLVLRELELRLVLFAYADDVLLLVQGPGDLARVEACQTVYSAASSARINWVKSTGLVVGDGWQASSLPPALQAIRWSAGPLLYLSVYLPATHPFPPENWHGSEGRVTYTILGRTIFHNLYLVRDLLELGRRDGLLFALRSLDQEKAFVRMDHGYLLGTLWAFGFGPQFVGFLQVLYAYAECLVRLKWTLTEPVSFRQGVRQGCPLSGQLYALAIEPFLCLLCWRLMRLMFRELELRLVLSAYAEDVLLVVQDPDDLVRVEACQAVYSAASSARVNWVKSSGLVVGDGWETSSLPPVLQTIRWSAGPLLYLGVYLSATHPSPPDNRQDLEARVGEQLRRGIGLFRCLSLRGRALVLNQLGDCKAQQSSVAAEAGSRGCDRGTYLAADSNSGLTEPKKLPNPVRESKTHQELHRELLFSHSRGLLPEHKPELQKVLENRRFKQLKQQQESQRPRTDLEEELRKRHRMLEQVCASQSFTNPAPATGSEPFPHSQQETATIFLFLASLTVASLVYRVILCSVVREWALKGK